MYTNIDLYFLIIKNIYYYYYYFIFSISISKCRIFLFFIFIYLILPEVKKDNSIKKFFKSIPYPETLSFCISPPPAPGAPR